MMNEFIQFIEYIIEHIVHPGFNQVRRHEPFNYIVFTYILALIIRLISKKLFSNSGNLINFSATKFNLTTEAQMDLTDLAN